MRRRMIHRVIVTIAMLLCGTSAEAIEFQATEPAAAASAPSTAPAEPVALKAKISSVKGVVQVRMAEVHLLHGLPQASMVNKFPFPV